MPPFAKGVPAYKCVSRGGWPTVWTEDPEKADPGSIRSEKVRLECNCEDLRTEIRSVPILPAQPKEISAFAFHFPAFDTICSKNVHK